MISGLYQPLPVGGLPNISIANFVRISDSGGSARAPQITQELTDNFTFVRSSHTFKAGIDIGFGRVSTNPSAGSPQFGTFSFHSRYRERDTEHRTRTSCWVIR